MMSLPEVSSPRPSQRRQDPAPTAQQSFACGDTRAGLR
jgi:hypothetical protein